MLNRVVIIILLFSMIFVGVVQASPIQWYDYETGIKMAENTGKPIMVFFFGDESYSKGLEKDVFNDSQVIEQLNNYICIKVNSLQNRDIGKIYKVSYPPTIIFTNRNGQIVNRLVGYVGKDTFIQAISEAWNKKDMEGEPILTKEDYNLGKVSIKELQNFIEQKKSQNFKIQFITEGTIRNVINTPIIIDDETGRLSIIQYQGGLGNINEGDKVIVEGYANPLITATKISLASSSPLNNIPNSQQNIPPKTNGFELLLSVTSILLLSRLFFRQK